MSDTPSGRIVSAANAIVEVTDLDGRKIGVRQIGALERLSLFEAVGEEDPRLVQNTRFMGYAALAASAVTVDGKRMVPMKLTMHVRAVVGILGDTGLNAIAGYLAHGRTDARVPEQADTEGEADSGVA